MKQENSTPSTRPPNLNKRGDGGAWTKDHGNAQKRLKTSAQQTSIRSRKGKLHPKAPIAPAKRPATPRRHRAKTRTISELAKQTA